MQQTEIKFEREDLEGLVAVGTYLADAAKRMGIELGSEEFGETEFSVVKIKQGSDLLSAPTKTEIENLSSERRTGGERFAEQAKIERAGEITIMTTKKKEETKPDYEAKKEAYRKEFEELPLEKKMASLVELEGIALSETLSFVMNSPYKLVGAVMDVMAEFGLKMEADSKKQKRPVEHHASDENAPPIGEEKTDKKTKTGKKAEPPSDSV